MAAAGAAALATTVHFDLERLWQEEAAEQKALYLEWKEKDEEFRKIEKQWREVGCRRVRCAMFGPNIANGATRSSASDTMRTRSRSKSAPLSACPSTT
eukprot:238513-Rhodomonas_salina.2